MKKHLFAIIAVLYSLTAFSQESYFHTQFIKDKEKVRKEAYKKLRNSPFYNEQDSLRIIFIYFFKDFNFSESEITNNQYLEKLEPRYRYSNYLLPFLFNRRFPMKKRLVYDGYVLDKANNLVALIGCGIDYPFRFRPYYSQPGRYDDKYKYLKDNVLTQEFDLCFRLFNDSMLWCIKDNKTYIYDLEQQKSFTLTEYYDCCWKYYSIGEIFGIPSR